ncbi:MAG: type II toxin-antitoxin system VapC family toxin [Anaerolineae bacterium]
MRRVFVDSSGWIALHNRRDDHHAQAEQAFKSLQNTAVRLITSDYVIDEALTHIRAWSGHVTAVRFGKIIRRHPLVEWIDVDADIWDAGWDIFVRFDDQEFSFTDCTSFAIMRERAIWEAFTFDMHFQQMGFQMWPASPSP